jgi:hypothetical protein
MALDGLAKRISDAIQNIPGITITQPDMVDDFAQALEDGLGEVFGGFSFRNVLINGGFDIWQRGIVSSSTGYQTADRWRISTNGSTHTHSRQSFSAGQTDVDGQPRYYSRLVFAGGSGSSDYVVFNQRIEDVRTLNGEQVTVSFWAKADSALELSNELAQVFGSGGSPSATVTEIGVQKHQLSTSWQKFSYTFTMPSLSGKTIGSNDDHYVVFNFWVSAGSGGSLDDRTDTLGHQSGTIDIANVQIEQGGAANAFEKRPIGLEQHLCYRYFYLINSDMHAVPGWQSTSYSSHWIDFPVRMRVAPTGSYTGTIGGGSTNHRCFDGSGYESFSGLSLHPNENGARLNCQSISSATAGRACGYYLAGDGTLEFDAEL